MVKNLSRTIDSFCVIGKKEDDKVLAGSTNWVTFQGFCVLFKANGGGSPSTEQGKSEGPCKACKDTVWAMGIFEYNWRK